MAQEGTSVMHGKAPIVYPDTHFFMHQVMPLFA
jgi:hypothetical protein